MKRRDFLKTGIGAAVMAGYAPAFAGSGVLMPVKEISPSWYLDVDNVRDLEVTDIITISPALRPFKIIQINGNTLLLERAPTNYCPVFRL